MELFEQPVDKFDQFWAAYPRRVAKGAARKAYRWALATISHDDLMKAVWRYAKACERTKPEFIKHPATYLRSECWLDEAQKPKEVIVRKPQFEPDNRKPQTPEQRREIAAKLSALIAKIDSGTTVKKVMPIRSFGPQSDEELTRLRQRRESLARKHHG